MRGLVFMALALSLALSWLGKSIQGDSPAKPSLIISGEVLNVGDPPKTPSFPFQLVKYRVVDVCEGIYDAREILVYHMVPAEGIKDLKPGDKVCLGVIKSFDMEEGEKRKPDDPATAYICTDMFIRRCQCLSKR